MGPPMTKRPVGLMWVLGVFVEEVGGDHGFDDVFLDLGDELLIGEGAVGIAIGELGVLGGDDDGVDADGLVVGVVLDRDLDLPSGRR